jgi:hypothetical protein
VHNEKAELPTILYFQTNNYTQENKNKYLFGLYAILVGLRYFEEVRVIGYIYSSIDKWFNCILHVLKRDINSLSKLLRLIQNRIPKHIEEHVQYA